MDWVRVLYWFLIAINWGLIFINIHNFIRIRKLRIQSEILFNSPRETMDCLLQDGCKEKDDG